MAVTLRTERPDDAATIEEVVAAAFSGAPHTSGTEQRILRELREAGALTVALVAEKAGAVVGHVAISPVTVSDGTGGWYGLGPVAVAPTSQGRGIGAELVREALRRLQAQGAAGCVVLGEPAYYGRFGFRAEPALRLPGVPPAYFQVLAFRGGVPAGDVQYHPAFS